MGAAPSPPKSAPAVGRGTPVQGLWYDGLWDGGLWDGGLWYRDSGMVTLGWGAVGRGTPKAGLVKILLISKVNVYLICIPQIFIFLKVFFPCWGLVSYNQKCSHFVVLFYCIGIFGATTKQTSRNCTHR